MTEVNRFVTEALSDLKASLEATVKAEIVALIRRKNFIEQEIAVRTKTSKDLEDLANSLATSYEAGKFLSEEDVRAFTRSSLSTSEDGGKINRQVKGI